MDKRTKIGILGSTNGTSLQPIIDAIENIAELKVDGVDYFGTGSFGLPDTCKILKMANWSSGA